VVFRLCRQPTGWRGLLPSLSSPRAQIHTCLLQNQLADTTTTATGLVNTDVESIVSGVVACASSCRSFVVLGGVDPASTFLSSVEAMDVTAANPTW
jgi:hypothetical protein